MGLSRYTRVRIAPVERWCEGGKKWTPDAVKDRAGRFVTIDPSSMWWLTDESGTFRNWHLVGEDLDWLRRVSNDDEVNSLCEHILELD